MISARAPPAAKFGSWAKFLVRAIWHDQSREAAANLTSTATGRAPTAARDWLASSAMRRSMAATDELDALCAATGEVASNAAARAMVATAATVRWPRRERGTDGAMACPSRRRGDGAGTLGGELGDRHFA
jgi:hypothetical protein